MAIELEKKYRLTPEQRDAVTETLAEFGAEPRGEDQEENIIFGSDSLLEANAVIRLRRIGSRTILTFKKRMPGISDVKQQLEEETEVADAASMQAILAGIGIEPRLIYEKRRRKWRFRSTEVVIDELPFGLYMEIEGSLTAIKEAELLLGADDLEPEEETYPRLTARLGTEREGVIESRF